MVAGPCTPFGEASDPGASTGAGAASATLASAALASAALASTALASTWRTLPGLAGVLSE